MNRVLHHEIEFPTPAESIFGKALFMGWYDGPTSGIVLQSSDSESLKLDILAWGPGEDRRIFALSPLANSDFEVVVALLSRDQAPKWPRWFPKWPSDLSDLNSLNSELEKMLFRAGSPISVIETDSMFDTVFSLKPLSGPILEMLPPTFDHHPSGDYDCWHKYLEASV